MGCEIPREGKDDFETFGLSSGRMELPLTDMGRLREGLVGGSESGV